MKFSSQIKSLDLPPVAPVCGYATKTTPDTAPVFPFFPLFAEFLQARNFSTGPPTNQEALPRIFLSFPSLGNLNLLYPIQNQILSLTIESFSNVLCSAYQLTHAVLSSTSNGRFHVPFCFLFPLEYCSLNLCP